MADYQDIRGLRVKYLSADPSVTVGGEVWYNSTTGTLRSRLVSEAWRSGALLNTGRNTYQGGSRNGTQEASRTAGGYTTVNVGKNEEYNGNGWSEQTDITTPRRGAFGSGTTDAAIIMGGISPLPGGIVEEWNGSSWAEQTDMTTPRVDCGSCGTQTATLVAGHPPYGTTCEEYDGSTWTTTGVLNTGRINNPSCGVQTAALSIGGQTGDGPTATTAVEEYDGSTWTTLPGVLPTAKQSAGSAGTTALAITFGGVTPPATTVVNTTYGFDGTSWSAKSNMGSTKYYLSGGMGTGSAGLAAGGNPGSSDLTEEYNVSTNVITAATWAAGTVFPTASSSLAGAGPQTAALGIGGYPEGSAPTGKSFEYDGTAWSNEATLNSNTGTAGVNSATGTQTACINSQNNTGGAPYNSAGEYDGSTWSNANDRPASNYSDASAGTLTAGLFFGGTSSPTGTSNATLEYDGTNWTVQNVMATGRSELGGSGTQTAALGSGGYSNPPPSLHDVTEEYNGTAWTTSPATMLTAVRGARTSGTQTDALSIGGGTPTKTTAVTRYDGTSWATSPSLATARSLFANGATSPVGAAWGSGGYYPGSSPNRTNTTEVFSEETSAANIETLTTS